jgi:hypothetical protein
MKPKSTLFIVTNLVASILAIGSVVVAQFGGGPEPKPGVKPAAPAAEASQPAALAGQGASVSEEAGPSVVVEPTNPADEQRQPVLAVEQSVPMAAASQPAVSNEQSVSAPAAGLASSAQNAFSMIVMSDPQLPWWRGGGDSPLVDVTTKGIETNNNMVNAINEIVSLGQWPTAATLTRGAGSAVLRPSGVIINGDLTAFWHEDQFELYQAIYSRVQYQIYPGLGNHDYENNYVTTPIEDGTCYYYSINVFDWQRCPKEAVWWMANEIEFALPNVVNKDLPRHVSVKNEGFFVARFGVRYMQGDLIRFELTDSYTAGFWRSILIPPDATNIQVIIERHTGFEWAIVDNYAIPGNRAAACYQVFGTTQFANSETTGCPKEWPDGSSGSLSYSFDIENFHFVQLHNWPGYEQDFIFTPSPPLPVFTPGLSGSLGFRVTQSYDWLRHDVQVASRAGKYIVINMHDWRDEPEFWDAIAGQNVVAIFGGHIHQNYGHASTRNNGAYDIPVFYSGSAECERFLLVEFHPRYFNVGVINSSTSRPVFVENDLDVCDSRGTFDDIDYSVNGAKPAPRTFFINRAPTVAGRLEAGHRLEGAGLSFRADGKDLDNDALTYQWAFGDGATAAGERPEHIYPDSGVYTITVTARDDYEGVATHTFAVMIDNVAPTATFANTSGPINVGGVATLRFTGQFDPSPVDTAAGFRYSYDCTDDGAFELENSPAAAFNCQYNEGGAFTARGRITDKDGGFTDYTAPVVVNAPPVALEDSHTLDEDTILNIPAPGVLANDTDVDGDILTAALVTGPANGLLALGPDGSFTYTPNADFNGQDRLSIKPTTAWQTPAPSQ